MLLLFRSTKSEHKVEVIDNKITIDIGWMYLQNISPVFPETYKIKPDPVAFDLFRPGFDNL